MLKAIDDLRFVGLSIAVTLHHALPEGDDLVSRFFVVHVVEAFPLVGRRNDDLAGHLAKIIKESFVLQRRHLGGGH